MESTCRLHLPSDCGIQFHEINQSNCFISNNYIDTRYKIDYSRQTHNVQYNTIHTEDIQYVCVDQLVVYSPCGTVG